MDLTSYPKIDLGACFPLPNIVTYNFNRVMVLFFDPILVLQLRPLYRLIK